jgi:hypothetical protein
MNVAGTSDEDHAFYRSLIIISNTLVHVMFRALACDSNQTIWRFIMILYLFLVNV